MAFALAHPRIDRLLRLNGRRVAAIVLFWFVAAALHNIVYGLLRGLFAPDWDEPFFFLIALFVIPAYLLIATLYTLLAPSPRRPSAP